MEMVSINGKMGQFTLANLRMDLKMAEVNGKKRKMYKVAILMMEIIRMIRKMAMVYLLGKVEMFIKEIIRMTREMDTVRCFGLTALITRENGEKVFSMAKVK